MNTVIDLQTKKILVDALRIYVTYYLSIKIINAKIYSRNMKIITYIMLLLVAFMCKIIKNSNIFLYSVVVQIFLLAIVFSISTKNKIGYSLCIISISLSINYLLYFISICFSYMTISILKINNITDSYASLIALIIIYVILTYIFIKIKKFKKGFSFLQKKVNDGYFEVLILNISIIVLFLIALMLSTNFGYEMKQNFVLGLATICIMMFITIQKSLKLYYKQKMLIKDLNETKEELANKNKEIEELEKENLNFSKISHSIAHKQKALEYKLNKLMTNSEIAEEIDLKDRLEDITKELKQETIIELTKTQIPEIDDMLAYMQSECVKNRIDFQLQLSGNIHHMVNNYIDKEKLEILLADLIKNAIIAINHSENENKSILVRLGIIEGIYSLYVYDSGIEFEIDTLVNLGIKPSTTHKDDGGTGMGMMNTFDTLKQYKASITINEYGKPRKDNFTKLIQITFDQKNEFKIKSYRQDEIEQNKNNNK